ncbi:hypothetical protein Taro_021940 [Colocasia esculenta]|uniref:Uncharacterized protein n=1 Tax=Colocasia esculenta TaxID=4460 RepID=A0A843V3W2_COLES|nr:hypothetical protein [Colocasia esculenta]
MLISIKRQAGDFPTEPVTREAHPYPLSVSFIFLRTCEWYPLRGFGPFAGGGVCNGPDARIPDSHRGSEDRHRRPWGHTPRVKYNCWGNTATRDVGYYGHVSSVHRGGSCCEVSPTKQEVSFTKKPSRDYQSPTGSNTRIELMCNN